MTNEPAGVLLDCDYIISLSVDNESTHSMAKSIDSKIIEFPQYMLRVVLYELATVLSRKFSHSLAKKLVMDLQESDIFWLDIDGLEKDIWSEFSSHNKKSISFFDCANLVAARQYNLMIASFDSFYPKSMIIR